MRVHTVPLVLLSLAFAACSEPPTAQNRHPGAAARASVAASSRTAFSGLIDFCQSGPAEKQWVTNGGILQVRGATNVNHWRTGNPLIDGVENNVVDGTIDLNTGCGVVHLNVTLTPA